MARKKNITEVDEQVTEQAQLDVAEGVVNADNIIDVGETKVEEQEIEQGAQLKGDEPVEIPEAVKAILARYPEYSELYVDSLGGVFTKGTQQNLVKDAILYQNPYYSNN